MWVTSNFAECQKCQVSTDIPETAIQCPQMGFKTVGSTKAEAVGSGHPDILFPDHRFAEHTLVLGHTMPGPSSTHSTGCGARSLPPGPCSLLCSGKGMSGSEVEGLGEAVGGL